MNRITVIVNGYLSDASIVAMIDAGKNNIIITAKQWAVLEWEEIVFKAAVKAKEASSASVEYRKKRAEAEAAMAIAKKEREEAQKSKSDARGALMAKISAREEKERAKEKQIDGAILCAHFHLIDGMSLRNLHLVRRRKMAKLSHDMNMPINDNDIIQQVSNRCISHATCY